MPRRIDLNLQKSNSRRAIRKAMSRYERANNAKMGYWDLAWIAAMTAVEIYATWERYAEMRLIVELNHNSKKFIDENNIRGVKRISQGLASVLVKTGSKYFDFRSTDDLINKANQLVGKVHNPFKSISKNNKSYLDTLSAIRNYMVHQSDSALTSYRRQVEKVYGLQYIPTPMEFLQAIDRRNVSLARSKPRLYGLAIVVKTSINHT